MLIGRPILKLVATEGERESLQNRVRRTKAAQALALRARIILSGAEGRTKPLPPMRPGQVEHQRGDNKRHGRTSLSGALNVALSIGLSIGLSLVSAHKAFSQDANPAQGRQPAISVSLRTERNTAKASAPVILKKTLTNRSDHTFTFGIDVYHPSCAVDVPDESGNLAPDRKPGYRRGRLDVEQLSRTLTPEELAESGALRGKMVWISLKPGETFDETCDISSFFDISKPGVYKISAQVYDLESASTVKSNLIEFTVMKSQ